MLLSGIAARGETHASRVAEAIDGRSGIVVILGADQLPEQEEFLKSGDVVVQVLESDPVAVGAARKRIKALNLANRISVMHWQGERLPYASNLINAVVAAGGAGQTAREEIERVLVPRGVGIIGDTKIVKAVPEAIDDWTHFLYDASGNAVCTDTRVGSPDRIQWCTDVGLSARDHDALASMSSMVSCNGLVFYIYDEGAVSTVHQSPDWKLIARDAFNGTLLWKRPIRDWVTHLYFFRSGPTWLTRRLVAVDDRVYATLGLEDPISALDARNGETLMAFAGTTKTEEFIIHGDRLLAVVGDPAKANREVKKPHSCTEFTIADENPTAKQIVACELATGRELWRLQSENLRSLAPLSLCARGNRAYYLDSGNLHCVGLADGKELWKAPFKTKGLFLRSYAPTVVAAEGAVLCLINHRLAAFAEGDGRLLWEKESGAVGFASPPDVFVIDDLAWVLPTVAGVGALRPKSGSFLNGGQEFLGMKLMTGEVVKRCDRSKVWPTGHHHRCYRNKATPNTFICGRRGVEFINLKDDSFVHNWWIRGICQYGVMPANGLLYVPPDPCKCFGWRKLNGFFAFSSGDESAPPDSPALVKGSAYGPPVSASQDFSVSASQDWPTYRHDAGRSGFTAQKLSGNLVKKWDVKLGRGISAVTVANGLVYLAEVYANRVHCLDAGTGSPKWRFTANGPIDSPPTLHKGMAIFGCRDGWVYALRADDGKLAWRFRAAPSERFIAQDGRLESAWPVSGSVLVLDDVVYFAAGRSSYLQGGIALYGLNYATGEIVHNRVLTSPETKTPMGGTGPKEGALPDVLCSDGSTIVMRTHEFGRDLGGAKKSAYNRLRAATGFLNDSWFHRSTWDIASPGQSKPWGNLLVFNARDAFGVQNPYTYVKKTPGLWPKGHRGAHHQQYSLYEPERFPRGVRIYAQPLEVDPGIKPKPLAPSSARKFNNPWLSSVEHHHWTHTLPMQVRAMVLAGDTLIVAGWRDDAEVARDAVELPNDQTKNAPCIYTVHAATGEIQQGLKLPARPVFDGMAVAGGKVFVPLVDGTLTCLTSNERKRIR